MNILKDDVILFNGDSITDALRDRSDKYSLAGYSAIIEKTLRLYCPNNTISCFNRGVGGDTSAQLLNRLAEELDEIKPTVFSLLIGVNDTWRRFDSNQIITAQEYGSNLKNILQLVQKYTRRIMLLEPFLLPCDKEKAKFREDLDAKIHVARQLAKDFMCELIPLDGIFAEISVRENPLDYSYDGAHPSELGHGVIAMEWLKRIKYIK